MLGFVMVFIAVGLSFWRLMLGPSLPDRVVALDMMTVAIVAFCGLAAIRSATRRSSTWRWCWRWWVSGDRGAGPVRRTPAHATRRGGG
jgi:hypothetical protein